MLGSTGAEVETFSLGGEGILRTHDREREAVPMILEALRLGVRYFDTAPAYAGSQDYYGAAFREAGPKVRDTVFLATFPGGWRVVAAGCTPRGDRPYDCTVAGG